MSRQEQQELTGRGAISPARHDGMPETMPETMPRERGGALSRAAGRDREAGRGWPSPGSCRATAGPEAENGSGAAPAGTDTAATADLSAAVEGAQRGNPDSFRILYRDTQPRLLRYLTYLVGSDAEDIASETWLQATRDLHSFRGGHSDFRGWITTIARHRALDHLRRHARHPPAVPVPAEDLAGLAAGDDTAARALENISTDAALRLIAGLPRDQAEAVLLRAVAGLDAGTAAKITGKRAGAVRTAAYRGLHALARHLEAAGPDVSR
jgi:RNA polymerase sigma-70 factor, ECF subfamily